jgi:hypothetical protein
VCSVLAVSLAVVAWLRFRRKRIEAKRLSQLGIDVKLSPSRDSREKTRIVKVKLPGFSVSIPSSKVAGEMPQSLDPISFHVGQ